VTDTNDIGPVRMFRTVPSGGITGVILDTTQVRPILEILGIGVFLYLQSRVGVIPGVTLYEVEASRSGSGVWNQVYIGQYYHSGIGPFEPGPWKFRARVYSRAGTSDWSNVVDRNITSDLPPNQNSLDSLVTLPQTRSTALDNGADAIPAMGFPFYVNGIDHSADSWLGSNSYVTFGYSSDAFSGFAANFPGAGIFVSADDRNISAAYMGTVEFANTSGFRIAYRGTQSPISNVPLAWDLTFYPNQTMILVTGAAGDFTGSGVSGLSDGTNWLEFLTLSPSTVYVFTGNANGTVWTVLSRPAE
jgi:hypothetical protein